MSAPTTPPSPLEVYLEWMDTLAPEVARELAAVLIGLCPGELLTPALVVASPLDGLAPRIRRAAGREPTRVVGMASTLCALTDLAFLERGTPSWSARTDELLGMLEDADADTGAGNLLGAELSAWVGEQRLRQPLRARQWARERERWEALRREGLAPDALVTWLRRTLLGV